MSVPICKTVHQYTFKFIICFVLTLRGCLDITSIPPIFAPLEGNRFLNDCEIVDVKELTEDLSGLHSVMLKLQAENLKLCATRRYFYVLLDSFPQFGQYLTVDS